MPSLLTHLARLIDRVNHTIGNSVAWLCVLMVLVQFLIVGMRYVFGIGSIMLQESVVYVHGALFMLAAADTLLQNEHVRVDIFYARASATRKALIDLLGCAFLVLPVCLLLFYVSWDYVAISWSVLEGSRETSGIQGVFLLKTVILIFAAQLALQAVSTIIKNAAFLRAPTQGQSDE